MRAILILLLACGTLSPLSLAADKKQLEAAVAAVDANLRTDAGKKYDTEMGKELGQKHAVDFKQCRQATSGKAEDFDMFLRLGADGNVNEVLIYPETAVAKCDRSALLRGQFSAPPHGNYWVNVHMQFKK